MRRRLPGLSQDGSAVSAVIGGVLLLALLVSTLITVRVSYAPVWSEGREAGHAQQLQTQLSDLKSELDREVDNRSTIAFANPVAMGAGGGGAFSTTKIPDRLQFLSEPQTAIFGASRLTLLEEDGRALDSLTELWSPVAVGTEVKDISDIRSFRLKVETVRKSDAGDDITITVWDSTGAFAGDFKFSVVDAGGPDFILFRKVRDAAQQTLYDNPLSQHNNAVLSPYWLDLMDEEVRLNQVFLAAKAPYRVAIAENGLQTDFSMVYVISAGGQEILTGGGGATPRFYRSYPSGTLLYENLNENYVNQGYFLEHGGLILDQAGRQTFRVEPTFTVGRVGNTTSVQLVLPSLNGAPITLMGESTVTVQTTPQQHRSVIGQSPMFVLTLGTNFPNVWTSFWSDRVSAIPGYVLGTHYLITNTTTTATLLIYGFDADVGSTYNDLSLTVRQANIEVRLRG